MSVPEKKNNKPDDHAIKQAILDAVSELYDEHSGQIEAIRSRAEGKAITVTFANDIDCSESQPVVKTKIRFCETYTDERTNKIGDPNQATMETIEHAGRGGRKSDSAPKAAATADAV